MYSESIFGCFTVIVHSVHTLQCKKTVTKSTVLSTADVNMKLHLSDLDKSNGYPQNYSLFSMCFHGQSFPAEPGRRDDIQSREIYI